MFKLGWIIGGLGWGLLTLAPPALAQTAQCRKVLQNFYQSLPSPHQVELPSDVKAIIAHSPLRKLGQKHAEGQGLLFSIDPLPKSSALNEIVIGEEIQAQFVAQVLTQSFPKAKFTGVRPKDLTPEMVKDQKLIEFRLVDSQERKAFSAEVHTNPTLLDMPLIKPANGSIRNWQNLILSLQKERPRNSMTGTIYLPAIYFDNEAASQRNPDLGSLGVHLRDKMGVKTLILSPNPRALVMSPEVLESMLRNHFPEFMRPYQKLILLSEVQNFAEIYQSEFNLVLNDTKGRMPFVYGLSDLAVVQGPINPLESVMVQTPTFAFVNTEVVGAYGFERYEKMVGAAQKSGKLKSVKSLDDLSEAEWRRLRAQNFTAPDLIQHEGASPLQVLLEVLQQKIQVQIE